MPRNMRSNGSTKKNDDRRDSRANQGMKSQDNRADDRETRHGKGANGNGGSPRKAGDRNQGNKRGH